MDKNNEYVGVDDKFVPENEKNESEEKAKEREITKKATKSVIVGYVCFISVIALFIIVPNCVPYSSLFIYCSNSLFSSSMFLYSI